MFHGTNLPGQTNATLMLAAMQPMMAGEYNVAVSNPVAMVANPSGDVAMLMMQRSAGSAPSLTLYSPMNGHYRIDRAPSLRPTPAWSMTTNFPLATNPYQVMLTRGSVPMQFYRAVPLP